MALCTALKSFYSKLSLAHTPFLELLHQAQLNPPIHLTWYEQSLTWINLSQSPNRVQTQRIPSCCETTLWPEKTSDLVFHCLSCSGEIYMSKLPSFCIWQSHHLSSSYKEREKTGRSICGGDPRKKQALVSLRSQRSFWHSKGKRGVFVAPHTGTMSALSGVHTKADELKRWDDPVIEAHREYTAQPCWDSQLLTHPWDSNISVKTEGYFHA